MKPLKLPALFTLLAVSCSLGAQIIRPFSHRYYNPAVRGNVVYVSNSIISTSGVGSGNPGTGEAPPAGSTRNNAGAGININAAGVGTTYIPFGSNWKYWSNTQANYQANWQTTAYNDAAWPNGNGELGYGDGDEATCIPSGGGGTLCTPTGNKWITAYFRKTINIPNPSAYSSFVFNVERDDGFVVYVNGVEVSRNNMPAGAVTWATPASSAIEDAVITFSVPPSAFVAGNNVIAVEVHQASVAGTPPFSTSSDLSFNLELRGTDVINSSTADLNLASCSNVLWAGLYWGAGQGNDGTTTGWMNGTENTCKLKVPGAAAYTNITATVTDYHNSTLAAGLNHTGYKCFADITSLINTASPNGTYTVADVLGPIGITNAYGGWTIVVAFRNDAEIIRELNVFDGNGIVDQGEPPIDINLNGFVTPPTGPVSCELGVVAFDGDRGQTDSFAFRQNGAPAFVNLTPNATSSLNDMWNSTISYKGSVVTTRNPAFQNTLGYDADIIDLPNPANTNLSNNQTAATIRLSSPNENYVLQVVTATISIKEPFMQLVKTSADVNGGLLLGLEELRYRVQYRNNGNDSSINTYIIDTIPTGTSYRPNSLLIGGIAKTDAAGDDEAEYDAINRRVIFRVGNGATAFAGGRVLAGAGTADVNFSVITPDICRVSSCVNPILNQATIFYTGATSGQASVGRSVRNVSGCFVEQPIADNVLGFCRIQPDTLIINNCPVTSVLIPQNRFVGYTFYSAMPFTPANWFNPVTPITSTRTIYAFFDGPSFCDDTVLVNFIITPCPDIDDDNDGIPDYVELDNPLALQDHDSDGIPNWNDPTYPGYVDFNSDNVNDRFDAGADMDNDGIPNFYDTDFPGFADANGDGICDLFDKDRDGLINQYDRDSDNDGIPDTAESFGVDANGDGVIDNYTDTDNDGFSQNVDANATGVNGSSIGLGALDTDGDGVPNYLDLDSDNDGIGDIVEVNLADANANGRVDVYADTDLDGYTDPLDADVGNDNIAENSAAAVLRTSNDGNSDGKCDTWPNQNPDLDSKPNPYDMDSDMDGILDVIEAGYADANHDGRVDGSYNSDGWETSKPGVVPVLPNTDGRGNINVYDIDSDDDGIPDNVEGLSTPGYLLPAAADTDNDGLDNRYDNVVGFGGNGIPPYDHDADGTPDYMDDDTDGDGVLDIVEGNDFNLNGIQDDVVSLLGTDADGDGLDDRFDTFSGWKGTSARMGDGGSFSGDGSPGSNTPVQLTPPTATDRDWRHIEYLLNCDFMSFKALLQPDKKVQLTWTVYCRQETDHFMLERSFDGLNFSSLKRVDALPLINETISYQDIDDVQGLTAKVIYYRLRATGVNGRQKLSHVVFVKPQQIAVTLLQVAPNPVQQQLVLTFHSAQTNKLTVELLDDMGRIIRNYSEQVNAGVTTLSYDLGSTLPSGMYYLRVNAGTEIITRKLTVLR